MRSYNLSATGGTDKIRYATSFGYLKQDGIIPSNVFKDNLVVLVTLASMFVLKLYLLNTFEGIIPSCFK